MTTATSKYKDWSVFTESREIWPFQISDDSLALSTIRYGEHEPFVLECPRTLDTNPLANGDVFEPELEIKIDEEGLLEKTALPLGDLVTTIVLRDRSLKRFFVVEKVIASEANGKRFKVSKETIDVLSLRSGLEIAILLTPKEKKGQYLKGSRLAQKVFSVSIDKEEDLGFPVATIDPDDDTKWPKEYSKDTAWFIHWIGDRSKIYSQDEDVSSILRVVYNEKIANKLYALGKVDKSISLFWSEVAVEIYLEIANVILSPDNQDDPMINGTGFYPRIARSLVKICGQESFDAVRALAKSPHSFQSFLRSKLQELFKFKSKADSIYNKNI